MGPARPVDGAGCCCPDFVARSAAKPCPRAGCLIQFARGALPFCCSLVTALDRCQGLFSGEGDLDAAAGLLFPICTAVCNFTCAHHCDEPLNVFNPTPSFSLKSSFDASVFHPNPPPYSTPFLKPTRTTCCLHIHFATAYTHHIYLHTYFVMVMSGSGRVQSQASK